MTLLCNVYLVVSVIEKHGEKAFFKVIVIVIYEVMLADAYVLYCNISVECLIALQISVNK